MSSPRYCSLDNGRRSALREQLAEPVNLRPRVHPSGQLPGRIRFPAVRLAHTRRGEGPPLVLLHGIGMRRGVWDPVLHLLARKRDVIALDLPGFGESPALPGHRSPTVATLADEVAGFVEGLGVERAAVAGNSLGGGLALELGQRGWARAVVALSPIGFYTRAELRYLRGLLQSNRALAERLGTQGERLAGSAAFRAALFFQICQHPSRIDAPSARADLRALRTSAGFEPARRMAIGWRPTRPERIQAPVTIAWGQHDRVLPRRQAARAQVALPQARHLILRGCGHVPMADDPEQVARVVLEGSAAG
jgi:pimeloyl-ACP methyl ester carboxylesterase